MDEKDLKQIEAMMTRVVGVFAEDVQHKLDLLAEGHQMLVEKKLDRVESKIDQVETTLVRKIDAVSGELGSHRRDTEAHVKTRNA
jgi:uncharacterized protein YydD (DUF2326 family)